MSVDVNLFGQIFELEKVDPLRTQDAVYHRWMVVHNEMEIAVLRNLETGHFNAYVNFDGADPVRRFNFWGIESPEAEDAIKTLSQSILTVSGMLSYFLRGVNPN